MGKTVAFLAIASLALAGCGGSKVASGVAGVSNPTVAPDPSDGSQSADVDTSLAGLDIPQFPGVVELRTDQTDGFQALRDAGTLPTPVENVPTTGAATYAGTILINGDAGATIDASVLGGVELVVDFEDPTQIRGGAGNFFNVDGSSVTGALVISDGAIVRGSNETNVVTSMTGRLENVGNVDGKGDFDYDVTLEETFAATDAATLLGVGEGTATLVDSGDVQTLDSVATLKDRR